MAGSRDRDFLRTNGAPTVPFAMPRFEVLQLQRARNEATPRDPPPSSPQQREPVCVFALFYLSWSPHMFMALVIVGASEAAPASSDLPHTPESRTNANLKQAFLHTVHFSLSTLHHSTHTGVCFVVV